MSPYTMPTAAIVSDQALGAWCEPDEVSVDAARGTRRARPFALCWRTPGGYAPGGQERVKTGAIRIKKT